MRSYFRGGYNDNIYIIFFANIEWKEALMHGMKAFRLEMKNLA